MRTRLFLAAAALVGSATPVAAQAPQPIAFISQAMPGAGDLARIEQVSMGSAVAVAPPPSSELDAPATITSDQTGNAATIVQHGAGEDALIVQMGVGNSATVTQFAADDRAVIVQDGARNVAVIRQ